MVFHVLALYCQLVCHTWLLTVSWSDSKVKVANDWLGDVPGEWFSSTVPCGVARVVTGSCCVGCPVISWILFNRVLIKWVLGADDACLSAAVSSELLIETSVGLKLVGAVAIKMKENDDKYMRAIRLPVWDIKVTISLIWFFCDWTISWSFFASSSISVHWS